MTNLNHISKDKFKHDIKANIEDNLNDNDNNNNNFQTKQLSCDLIVIRLFILSFTMTCFDYV